MAYAQITPFGADVKKSLIDKRMTQVELSGMLGIQKQYLTEILSGRKSGAKYRARICKILGLNEDKYSIAA